MSEVEEIIKNIEHADEIEILEFDFDPCFQLMREMESALNKCKETFDFFRMVRGCDGQLGEAVKAVDKALTHPNEED